MSTPGDLLEALGREASARLAGRGSAGHEAYARVYRGRTIDELIPRIQSELGADAIILRRREGLTGGVLGFFQHPCVEIEAMPGGPRVDLYDEEPPAGEEAAPAPPAPAPPPALAPAAGSCTGACPRRPRPPPAAPPPPPAPPPVSPVGRYAAGLRRPEPPVEPETGSAYVTARLAALARANRATIAPRPAPVERPRTASFDFQELLPREPRRPAAWPAPAPVEPERRTVAAGSHGRARAGVEKSLRRFGVGEEMAEELIDGASAHALPLAPRSGLAQAVRSDARPAHPGGPAAAGEGRGDRGRGGRRIGQDDLLCGAARRLPPRQHAAGQLRHASRGGPQASCRCC